MTDMSQHHVAIFVPRGRESLIRKIKAAVEGPMGPFDLSCIAYQGRTEEHCGFDEDARRGLVTAADLHYGYPEMGLATTVEWTFFKKFGMPWDEAHQFGRHLRELGLGMRWHCASDSDMKWNPVSNEFEDHWETKVDVMPSAISETERALDPTRELDFTKAVEQ